MKILLIHTYYNTRGGEDQVFEQEYELLSSKHEVKKITFQNLTGLKGIFQFFMMKSNASSNNLVSNIIEDFKPELVHIHNLHFGGGYGIINIVKKFGLPLVMTVHNYRLLCPSGTLFDGKTIFLNSYLSSFPWVAIFKGVYRQSVMLTFWLSLVIYFQNRNGTLDKVDNFIVLTDFARDLYQSSKLHVEKSKFIVKPNYISLFNKPIESFLRTDSLLYVGRLSEEKGIDMLFDLVQRANIKIRFAGIGPLLPTLKNLETKIPSRIEYLGVLKRPDILKNMCTSDILVFPSMCYEGMPMTIIEAFSVGLPVIANNLGAMSTMIEEGENGFLFDGTQEDLLFKIELWKSYNKAKKDEIRKKAYQSYLNNYTEESNLKKLEEIYTNIIKANEESN